MRTSSRPFVFLRATVLLGVMMAVLPRQVPAAPLEEYTGLSTPVSTPMGPRPQDSKILAAAFAASRKAAIIPAAGGRAAPKAVAGTIFASVLDRFDGNATDPWGIGVKDFEKMFVAGRGTWKRQLDTKARYLYLYQVFNDHPKTDGFIFRADIRLLVDPRLITSWGYFAQRRGKAMDGLGFSVPGDAGKKGEAAAFVPIAAETTFGGERAYEHDDKFHLSRNFKAHATKFFHVARIPVRQGNVAAAAGGVNDPIIRTPDRVMLTLNAFFDPKGELHPRYRQTKRTNDERRLGPFGPWRSWNWPMDAQVRGLYDTPLGLPFLEDRHERDGDALPDRPARDAEAGPDGWDGLGERPNSRVEWPNIRALFDEDPLRPGEGSTIFGFTSDLPPVFDLNRVSDNHGFEVPKQGAALERKKNDIHLVRFRNEDIRVVRFQPPGGQASSAAATPAATPTPAPPGGPPAGGAPPGGGGGAVGGLGGFGSGVSGGGLGGMMPSLGGGGGFGGPMGGATGGGSPLSGGGATGGGGALGGGSGSGNGQTQPGQTQNQTPTQAQAQTPSQNQSGQGQQAQTLTNTNTNIVNVFQQQQQQQRQRQSQSQNQNQRQRQTQHQNQHQHQNQNHNHGHVVPAPPAWLLGVFGLPVFAFLGRRRKANRDSPPADADGPPVEADRPPTG